VANKRPLRAFSGLFHAVKTTHVASGIERTNFLRTIHLRQNSQGTWYVSVTQDNHPVLSNTPYASTPHALRAFIYEGHQQPFARMLVHGGKSENAVLVRRGRASIKETGSYAIDAKAIQCAAAKA
jgi:hypothetical protein